MIANLSPFFDQIAGIERALVDEERVSQINVPRFHRVQPVHVVYGGGHLFRPDFKAKLGRLACAALEQVAEDGLTLNTVLQTMWPNDFADRIYSETLNKLRNRRRL
ncbi:MAG: hypothetical protein NTV34_03460 [Proteobacteria bacterium]|nr:hypothetical protein [Pseudomonadota bacterium]